ncbi:hypothetical protein SCARD494_07199 [Seiridium cardinale]
MVEECKERYKRLMLSRTRAVEAQEAQAISEAVGLMISMAGPFPRFFQGKIQVQILLAASCQLGGTSDSAAQDRGGPSTETRYGCFQVPFFLGSNGPEFLCFERRNPCTVLRSDFSDSILALMCRSIAEACGDCGDAWPERAACPLQATDPRLMYDAWI